MAALDFPDSPTVGQVFDKWTWNGTMWQLTPGGAAGYTFTQDTAPTPRKVGDTWFDTSTGATGGTSWVAIEEGAAGSEKVWVQTSPGAGAPPPVKTIGGSAVAQTGAMNGAVYTPLTWNSWVNVYGITPPAPGGFAPFTNLPAGVWMIDFYTQSTTEQLYQQRIVIGSSVYYGQGGSQYTHQGIMATSSSPFSITQTDLYCPSATSLTAAYVSVRKISEV